MTFAIQSGIAKPAHIRRVPGLGRESKYPFASMQVGDMFHVPVGDADLKATRRRMAAALVGANKRHAGKRFSARTIEFGGVEGVGVWRDA